METELSIMGAEQSDLIIKTIPGAYGAKKCENGFTITKNVKTFVACNYKFSPTGFDDVAKFYRIAKKEKAFLIIVLGRMPKREVMVLASSLDISFRFVKSKKLHKFLLTRNALMPKRKKVKSRVKPRLSSSLNVIFARNRAKYFAFSGLSLALFSFLGIMRIYYLITCGVCLALALFCAVRKT